MTFLYFHFGLIGSRKHPHEDCWFQIFLVVLPAVIAMGHLCGGWLNPQIATWQILHLAGRASVIARTARTASRVSGTVAASLNGALHELRFIVELLEFIWRLFCGSGHTS